MSAVQYTIDIAAYPRFKYFRWRLTSIVDRLEKLVDAGNFAACVSQGKSSLDLISLATKYLQGEIRVTLVGDDVKVPASFPAEMLAHANKKRKAADKPVTQKSLDQKTVVEDMKSSSKFHPNIVICLLTSVDAQNVKHLFSEFSSLEHDQLENFIIYDVVTKTNYSFLELHNAKFDKQAVELGTINKTIGEQIQGLLEDRVMQVLENIVVFDNNFAPGDGSEMPLEVYLQCSDEVVKSFRSPQILDDLDPLKTWKNDTKDSETKEDQNEMSEEEQDTEFHKNLLEFLSKKTKNILIDHLSMKYGIKAGLLNEFLNQGYHDYEHRYREAVIDIVKPKWSRVKRCTEASTIAYRYITGKRQILTAVEDYVKKVLRYLVEFERLNFEAFGLLRKTEGKLEVEVPTYPKMPDKMAEELLSLPEVVGCGTIYGKLVIHVKDTPKVPKYPYLREQETLEDKIKQVLSDHHYEHGFKVHTFIERNSSVRAFDINQSGDVLKARFTDEGYQRQLQKYEEQKKNNDKLTPPGRDKLSSLGCVIGLRDKTDKSDSKPDPDGKKGADGSSDMKSKGGATGAGIPLYGITCAHCVSDCHPDVQVRLACRFHNFGQTELQLSQGETIDIAAIRVTTETGNCICIIRREEEKEEEEFAFADWQFYEGEAGDDNLTASHVYKYGATTGYTEGVVISNDYRPELRRHFRDSIIREANLQGYNFSTEYNIFIDILPASRPLAPVFSPDEEEHRPQASDEQGDSQAEAMDVAAPSVIHQRDARSAPRFSQMLPESLTVRAREKVQFECVVEGNPRPQVEWFYGQIRVGNIPGTWRLETEGNTHRLIIENMISQDVGIYQVEATNIAGTAESTCTLAMERELFSKSGDSGSVVCFTRFDETRFDEVHLMSLLCGSIDTRDERGEPINITYSSHLKKSLDALCERYNKEIVMPQELLSSGAPIPGLPP